MPIVILLSSHSVLGEEVKPFHVFREVQKIEEQVILLLTEQGISPRDGVNVDVSSVSPREVYSMVRLFVLKSMSLSQSGNPEGSNIPDIPIGTIEPKDVLEVARIGRQILMTELGIEYNSRYENIDYDHSKTPTDVFKLAFKINRLLNQILPIQVTPSDVYNRVSMSVNYCDLFIDQWNVNNPDPNNVQTGKRPADVINQLQKCYQVLEVVATAHDYQLMHLESSLTSSDIRPVDVYDWAIILHYQLTYMYTTTLNMTKVPDEKTTAQTFTSDDVFAAAVGLEKRLNAMIGNYNGG